MSPAARTAVIAGIALFVAVAATLPAQRAATTAAQSTAAR